VSIDVFFMLFAAAERLWRKQKRSVRESAGKEKR
jgi:hypothetical protein